MRKTIHLISIMVSIIALLIGLVKMQISSTTSSKSANSLTLQGINAYKSENYEAAIEKFEKAIEAGVTEDEPGRIYTVLGNAYDKLGQFDHAITAHRKAIEINPGDYKAWVSLGIDYRHVGELDEAEKCYMEALDLEPEYAELHASLGVLYIVKNELQKAIEALEKAIALDANLAAAHGNIALAYAMADRFEDAYDSLIRATALGYQNSQSIKERIEALKTLRKEKEES